MLFAYFGDGTGCFLTEGSTPREATLDVFIQEKLTRVLSHVKTFFIVVIEHGCEIHPRLMPCLSWIEKKSLPLKNLLNLWPARVVAFTRWKANGGTFCGRGTRPLTGISVFGKSYTLLIRDAMPLVGINKTMRANHARRFCK